MAFGYPKESNCLDCGKEYTQKTGLQKRCENCSKKHAEDLRKKWLEDRKRAKEERKKKREERHKIYEKPVARDEQGETMLTDLPEEEEAEGTPNNLPSESEEKKLGEVSEEPTEKEESSEEVDGEHQELIFPEQPIQKSIEKPISQTKPMEKDLNPFKRLDLENFRVYTEEDVEFQNNRNFRQNCAFLEEMLEK